MKVNIAIDGPSGVGKSTVAKELAKILGYTFINSGSIYRAITKNVIDKGIDTRDAQNVIKTLENGMIKLLENDKVQLYGVDVSTKLRADYISQVTPNIAKIPEVRNYVVNQIKTITNQNKGYIIDGRDTTFKIMPHAEVKIFLWASAEERAHRRIEQNRELMYNVNFNEILLDIQKRDEQDMNREIDPLHKTHDSTFIDCTNLTLEELLNVILKIVESKTIN